MTDAHVIADLPAAEYHEREAMSQSGAKKILRSPQHYKLARDTPSESTAPMLFGTAVHAGVLEPDTFAAAVVCAPDVDKRTNAGKAAWQEFQTVHAGALILAPDAYGRVLRCVDAVLAHPAARAILDGARREVSLFWNDGQHKVPCKARYDALRDGIIADLKTTADASPDGFARQAAALLYHVQAAHYISGAEHCLNASPENFVFICVENEPPHAVACYTMPADAILAGAHLMSIALERYAAALAAGEWPGYPQTIERLKFPKYALRFDAV